MNESAVKQFSVVSEKFFWNLMQKSLDGLPLIMYY